MSEITFSKQSFETRMNAYFEILSEYPNLNSVKEVLEETQKKYNDDYTVNYNRLQRDIKKFLKEKNIISKNPIEELKKWKRKYYMPISQQDYLEQNALDISFECPNAYVKTNPYEAEKMGHHLRDIFKNLKPFVIADYDTVLIHFSTQEKYDAFKAKFDNYL